jgi:DNA-directed RNA polymerase subunit RPC12/RpoP
MEQQSTRRPVHCPACGARQMDLRGEARIRCRHCKAWLDLSVDGARVLAVLVPESP